MLPEEYLKNGGPGRPKGSLSGRSQCLAILDKMMAEAGNQEKLAEAFQRLFDKNPAGFYLKFIQPILPKELGFEEGAMKLMLKFVEAKKPDDNSG